MPILLSCLMPKSSLLYAYSCIMLVCLVQRVDCIHALCSSLSKHCWQLPLRTISQSLVYKSWILCTLALSRTRSFGIEEMTTKVMCIYGVCYSTQKYVAAQREINIRKNVLKFMKAYCSLQRYVEVHEKHDTVQRHMFQYTRFRYSTWKQLKVREHIILYKEFQTTWEECR